MVPLLAILIIGADIVLDACFGSTATYTSVIRTFCYKQPAFWILLSGALGALWAHLCWTPGGEIMAIRYELERLGCWETKEVYRKGQFCVEAHHYGINNPCSGWYPTARLAWRDALKQVKIRLSLPPLP